MLRELITRTIHLRKKSFREMVELCSRPPATLTLPPSDKYARLNVADAVLNLSALLLDEHGYAALKTGNQVVDGAERTTFAIKATSGNC
ncbi:hypothetical protein [Hyphomonas sp.]|uniref:hypothetical protein n=1 Tax=Hyphomonas sp. TaxID=87 RepID=UPI00333F49EC